MDIDANGEMRPKYNEAMVEMGISHDVKSWDDLVSIVKNKFAMNVIGQPWIANSGRHFKTVGFRTARTDFEAWRRATFNWQDSGIREVKSSRLYR